MPGVELVLTTLHSGGKYARAVTLIPAAHTDRGQVREREFGVVSVEVSREARSITWSSSAAKTTKKLEVIGKAKERARSFTFKPDPNFSGYTEFKGITTFRVGLTRGSKHIPG